jgi:hypothetical protein
MNNRGVATVVAASILLAAIVTALVTYQAFIVPEQNRESAFAHSQGILNSFQQLYTEGASTITLAYSGAQFLSSTTFPGQLSYTPSTNLNVTFINATQLIQTQTLLTNQTGDIPLLGLTEATVDLENVTDNVLASYNFTGPQKTSIQLNSETLTLSGQQIIRVYLNITGPSDLVSYRYSLLSGDSLHLPLFGSPYNLTSTLQQTTNLEYETNSSSCRLFLNHLVANYTDLSYSVGGAILYKPSSFPLSYIATPWGITAVEAGTSSIPVPIQIQWSQDTLHLDLYNITWTNTGTISGSGSVGIKLIESHTILLHTNFDSLALNFTSNTYNLQNSIQQLQTMLQSGAPDDNTAVSIQQGADSSLLTITSPQKVSLTIHNVNAVLS